MNLKEYIKHMKSICKQGILRHKNIILDETFQKELLEIIKCYEQLEQDNQELKEQLEERPKEYVFIGNAQNKTRDFINEIVRANKELENQQKEFIKYLEDKLCIADEVLDEPEEDEEVRGYVLARKFMLEEILSKYKEIIGGKDGTKNI